MYIRQPKTQSSRMADKLNLSLPCYHTEKKSSNSNYNNDEKAFVISTIELDDGVS